MIASASARGVGGRNDEPVPLVRDHLGEPAYPGHDRRLPERHRLQQRDRQPLLERGQHEHVEGRGDPQGVLPVAGEHHGTVQAELACLRPERPLFRALADEHEARLRHGASDERRRMQEMLMTLVPLQVPDRADDRGTVRDTELLQDAVRRLHPRERLLVRPVVQGLEWRHRQEPQRGRVPGGATHVVGDREDVVVARVGEEVRPAGGGVVARPQVVLRVDERELPWQRDPGPHHRVRRVSVDQIDVPVADQGPELGDPPHSPAVSQTVRRDAGGLDLGHERVLPRQQVGHLGLEARAIHVPDGRREQALGAASPESLDEEQDPGQRSLRSVGRPECFRPGFVDGSGIVGPPSRPAPNR